MNKSFRTIFLSLICALGVLVPCNSMQGMAQPSPFADGVKAALMGAGIAGTAFLARAAYLKYILYGMPELTLDPNPATRKEGNSKKMRLYQWGTLDTPNETRFPTPGSIYRAHQKKSLAEDFLSDCNSPHMGFYYQCGDTESEWKCERNPKNVLQAIQYEIQRLTKFMDRLKWSTSIAGVYGDKIQNIVEEDQSYDLHGLTEKQEEEIFTDMEAYIARLSKPKNWAWWFANTVFGAFQEEADQKYWDLFVARSRLHVLEEIVLHEKKRKEKEQEERLIGRRPIGDAHDEN